MSPRKLFRAVAFAEAVTWTLLIIGLILKYGTETTEIGVRIGGGIHGFVFLCYVVVTVFLWVNQKWSAKTGALAVVSAVVPYATIPVEKSLDHRGMLDGGWRLAEGGEEPHGFIDKLQAWVLRHLMLAVVIAVVAVAVVFSVLLLLGPPGEWFN